MWYLTPECSPLDQLISALERRDTADELQEAKGDGEVYKFIEANAQRAMSTEDQWAQLGDKCCTMMKGAP